MNWGKVQTMSHGRTRGGKLARLAAVSLAIGVAGCADFSYQSVTKDEAPTVLGPMVRQNRTPLEGALACLAIGIQQAQKPRISVAVGDVKDYTGKYAQDEGPVLTQGGALMVYSALGKLGNSVQVAERFDTRIAELELAYTDRRQLGDGQQHPLDNGQKVVPWLPYFGGTIMRSDYYIVGGITELNYNIQSGGVQGSYNQLGPKARVFTLNIGVDLRIVDTRTLMVVKTVSLEKQITGHEVGFNIFRFFGSNLWDVDIGEKSQEPIELGVRTTLEEGVVQLVGAVEAMDTKPCLADKEYWISEKSAEEIISEAHPAPAGPSPATPPAPPTPPAPYTGPGNPPSNAPASAPAPKSSNEPAPQASTVPGGATTPVAATAPVKIEPLTSQAENSAGSAGQGTFDVSFDFGATDIGGQSSPEVDRIAELAARGGSALITVTARNTESWAPIKRAEITQQRIRAVVDALTARGIPPDRIQIAWTPGPTDAAIVRDGSGFQMIAKLSITRA